MTFRTKGHSNNNNSNNKHRLHPDDDSQQHREHRCDKTDLQQPLLAAARSDTVGGTPCIYTAYGPRCYVIQKVSAFAP